MTMIVALQLDAYVLIAADRRETYQVNGEVAYVISDDRQKLIQWSGGIVTGSGYVPLLSEFKSKIADAKITFVDEIIEIAQECCNNLSGDQSEWKKTTNWLFTYGADSPEGEVSRVAFIKSQEPEGIHVLEVGESLIWAKIPDYKEELSNLKAKIRPEKDLSNINCSLSYHTEILKELYAYVAKVNPSVSEAFDCYLHSVEVRGMVPVEYWKT
ncbi:Ntn hydrolase family protein [Kangiella koreensis]|uniref:20S proteasome A and B subunits n=1 Tax=Kangiella koreensis (strain DSM 16069 / JCM 12317 / KCTC 12182 / SW-125) TaxID=523791 RepID=C7R649_KANKD|nr:hypothetical protein [Kangiella koreensis]ACV25480.1 hypothetical protein Kkor_0058 [Kangiella koreensis DSM 16069]